MKPINVHFFSSPTLMKLSWNSIAILFVYTDNMESNSTILKTLQTLVLLFASVALYDLSQ